LTNKSLPLKGDWQKDAFPTMRQAAQMLYRGKKPKKKKKSHRASGNKGLIKGGAECTLKVNSRPSPGPQNAGGEQGKEGKK